jgi:hypothetical protein
MAHESEGFNLIDRFTSLAMKQSSRRGFLKGVGASGLAFVGVLFGIGGQERAFAYIPCPDPSYGVCNNCYSACVSGGRGGSCVCASCNCIPARVYAECSWQRVGSGCYFSFRCVAC